MPERIWAGATPGMEGVMTGVAGMAGAGMAGAGMAGAVMAAAVMAANQGKA